VRNDQEIKKEIEEQMKWDIRVERSDVKVSVQDGIATLEGIVPSLMARKAAEGDSYKVGDVKSVMNNLQVEYPESSMNDEDLAFSVREVLKWDSDIDNSNVRVKVSGFAATLEGSVASLWQKFKAGEDAANIFGITSVKNELAVVPSGDIADELIASNLQNALKRNVFVDADKINVEVDGGKVEISGTVRSWIEKDEVMGIALYTVGVRELRMDGLKVG
jgi:hyperosmotically inducible periplasmic protein